MRQATGFPAVAALSSGNLESIARQIRASHPDAQIIVLADIVKATGGPDPHAAEAAKAVGGILAVPSISIDAGTDFNDQYVAHGLASVRATIEAAIQGGAESGPAQEITRQAAWEAVMRRRQRHQARRGMMV